MPSWSLILHVHLTASLLSTRIYAAWIKINPTFSPCGRILKVSLIEVERHCYLGRHTLNKKSTKGAELKMSGLELQSYRLHAMSCFWRWDYQNLVPSIWSKAKSPNNHSFANHPQTWSSYETTWALALDRWARVAVLRLKPSSRRNGMVKQRSFSHSSTNNKLSCIFFVIYHLINSSR